MAKDAFGRPGSPGRWTLAGKGRIGTVFTSGAPWFTLCGGTLKEVYTFGADQTALRNPGLLVTGPGGFFSEATQHADSSADLPCVEVVRYRLTNTSRRGRYRSTKEALTHLSRPVGLKSRPLDDCRPYAPLASHRENQGAGNAARVGVRNGKPAVIASPGATGLRLPGHPGWRDLSQSFVGASDGWQDLVPHGRLTRYVDWSRNGDVALAEPQPQPGATMPAPAGVQDPDAAAHPGAAVDASPDRAMGVCTHPVRSFPVAPLSAVWRWAQGGADGGEDCLAGPRDLVAAAGGHDSGGNCQTVADSSAQDSHLGVDHVDMPTPAVVFGAPIRLTLCRPRPARWEGRAFAACVRPV